MDKSVRAISGRLGVRIPAGTDLKIRYIATVMILNSGPRVSIEKKYIKSSRANYHLCRL